MTVDIADELRRRFAEYDDVPDSVEQHSRWQGAEVWTRTLRTSSRIIKVAPFCWSSAPLIIAAL